MSVCHTQVLYFIALHMLGEYNSKADTSLSQRQSDASSGLTLDVCIQRELTVHYEEFFFPDLCHAVEKNPRNIILILRANLTMIKPWFIYSSQASEFICNFDIGNETCFITIWRNSSFRYSCTCKTKNGQDQKKRENFPRED